MNTNNINKISILIKKLALEFDKIAIPVLAPYELTPSQYKILKFLLVNNDKDFRQRDIEKAFSMTNPTVTGILQNLEKNGWIQRAQNSDDARCKLIKLTDKTLNQESELKKVGKKLEQRFIKGLSEEEQEELKRLLNKLFINLKE